jgi:serine/threonine protein kinase
MNASASIVATVNAFYSNPELEFQDFTGINNLTGRIRIPPNVRPINGSYGDVYRGMLVDSSKEVAVKIVRSYLADDDTADKMKRHFCRELAVWRGLKHPNVVCFLGISCDFGQLPSMISPWYRNGNAISYLRQHPNANRIKILRGVASAVRFMHEQNPPIIHGDLKAENVLISDDGEGLVSDFGVAKVTRESGCSNGFTTTAIQGTFAFMAPELHEEPNWTPATDVYAFAGTCLQIITGLRPFHDYKGNPIIPILRGKRPKRPANFLDDRLWNLLWLCWSFDPSARVGIFVLSNYLNRGEI